MKSSITHVTYEIDLQPGETFTLPESLVNQIGAGSWIVTIKPKLESTTEEIRNHQAFLNGYAPEDEGLYDDYPIG